MSRITSNRVKTLKAEENEYPCPAPLRERIGLGRGTSGILDSSPSSSGAFGRGLLARKSRNPGEDIVSHHQPQIAIDLRSSVARPSRAAKSKAIQVIHQLEGYEDDDAIHHVNCEIDEDDVALTLEDNCNAEKDEDTFSCDLELDELVDTADDWVFRFDKSDSGESSSDEVEPTNFFSKDGTEWYTRAEVFGRRPARNILTQRSGFKPGIRPQSRVEAFYVVFEENLDSVVRYTNLAGRRLARDENFVWKNTNRMEMEAFIGLHILAGALKAHHRCIRELYNVRDGIPLFRATMSENRFEQLKACLRFDDPARRNRDDKGAPVRDMLQQFNTKMLQIYTPGENLTIDEMLVEFHGRVSFRQYIPTKPGKYGLKIYWVAEAATAIPLKCLLYVGKDTVSEISIAKHGGNVPALVMDLMEPFLDAGRNVTTDNWFTSQRLALKLCDRRTSLVGTLKRNSTCLPSVAKSTNGRRRGDSIHYYSTITTICSFWDKGSKTVNILSSMHGTQNNHHADEGKSEIVQFYNNTKSGVDTLDKLVRGYSSKRKYRRWPCHIFLTLIDSSIYTAYMMRKLTSASTDSHYNFKIELAYELALPLVRCRLKMSNLKSSVKEAMRLVGIDAVSPNLVIEPAQSGGQGRCYFCAREKDRKVKTRCQSCGKHICPEHQVVCCRDCH